MRLPSLQKRPPAVFRLVPKEDLQAIAFEGRNQLLSQKRALHSRQHGSLLNGRCGG
jgi:hypothetical protein